jgi:hypothetical protein
VSGNYLVAKILEERNLKASIDQIFDFLNSTDYGLSEWRQHIEAHFWDRFFDYFAKLQRTEQNRILTQLADACSEIKYGRRR